MTYPLPKPAPSFWEKTVPRLRLFLFIAAWLFPADPVSALQVHPAPEGLYAHQLAHVFFIVTMGIFAFWLRKRNLTAHSGWRWIRISCLLFILWNLNAFIGHGLDAGLADSAFVGKGWSKALLPEALEFPYVYYLMKLDHLICVPAIAALYMGLKRLRKTVGKGAA